MNNSASLAPNHPSTSTCKRTEASLSGQYPPRYIEALDGLRGIAVLSVLLFHFGSPLERSTVPLEHWISLVVVHGMRGVDLFFALSGFLITRILVDTRQASNYFVVFYMRRVLRIFPVYFCFLLLVFLLLRLAQPEVLAGLQFWPYTLFVSNFKQDAGLNDPYLSHMWSLAVEEQFYLIWPVVILICPPRMLLRVALSLTVLVSVCRFLFVGHVSVNMLLRLTPFRADALLLGGIVALLVADSRYLPLLKRFSLPAIVSGIAMWAITRHSNAQYSIGYSGLALAFAAIVAWAVTRSPRVLLTNILRRLGKYSYALYVYHLLIGYWIWRQVPIAWQESTAGRLMFLPAAVACSYGAAVLSFRVLESPFLKMKRKFEPKY